MTERREERWGREKEQPFGDSGVRDGGERMKWVVPREGETRDNDTKLDLVPLAAHSPIPCMLPLN